MKITPKRLREIINEEVGKFVKDSTLAENKAAERHNEDTPHEKKVTCEGKSYYFTEKEE